MRRSYHLPTEISVPDGISAEGKRRLNAVVLAAIGKAVRDAAPGETAQPPFARPEPRERVLPGADRHTYAIPSYGDDGKKVAIPVAGVPQMSMTPEELRYRVGRIVDELNSQQVAPERREALMTDLAALEDVGEAEGTQLPEAVGYHLLQVVYALASDLKTLAAAVAEEAAVAEKFVPWDVDRRWALEQLEWAVHAVEQAQQKIIVAQVGGPRCAEQFQAAGKLLTAAIPVVKASMAHMAYLRVVTAVEHAYAHSWSAMMAAKLAAVRESFQPLVAAAKEVDSPRFDQAVADLLREVPTWRFDFSQFVDELEEKMKNRERFLQWLNLLQLAWLAFDIWMLPVTGSPGPSGGRGGPPVIGGSGGAGVAGGALVSVESLEALRRLVRAGILTNPALVKVVGGGQGPLPRPEPMHAGQRPEGPKGKAGAQPTGGATGKSTKADPHQRPEPGLPSAAEDALVQQYTRGLANLREKQEILRRLEADATRPKAEVDRARAAAQSAERTLDLLEEQALNHGGEALEHLNALTRERGPLRLRPFGTTTGRRVPCEAVRLAPKNLRDMDFAEIEKAMTGHKPTVGAKPREKGAPEASGHQRLTWKLKDGSELVVDRPRDLSAANRASDLTGEGPGSRARPVSADRPHAELHGPKGERLDAQGIEVPKESIAAHITITDVGNLMERYFASARKGM